MTACRQVGIYEFELLTTAAASGGTGVAAALRDPSKVLPALATLRLGLEELSPEARYSLDAFA